MSTSCTGDSKDQTAFASIGGEPRPQLQSEAFPTQPATLAASEHHLEAPSEPPRRASREVADSALRSHAVQPSGQEAAMAIVATGGAPAELAPAVAAHARTEVEKVPRPAVDGIPDQSKVILCARFFLPIFVLCWRCAALTSTRDVKKQTTALRKLRHTALLCRRRRR